MTPKSLDDIVDTLARLLPASSADAKKNLRAAVTATFDRLELITREEIEVQEQVLARTRTRLEEMEKRWREENERIMRLHPANAHYPEPGQPDDVPPVAETAEPKLPLDETQPEDEIPVEKRPLP